MGDCGCGDELASFDLGSSVEPVAYQEPFGIGAGAGGFGLGGCRFGNCRHGARSLVGRGAGGFGGHGIGAGGIGGLGIGSGSCGIHGCGIGGKYCTNCLDRLAKIAASNQHPTGGRIPHTVQGPGAGTGIAPAYNYPYYTTRGPRDFLMKKPPSIGY